MLDLHLEACDPGSALISAITNAPTKLSPKRRRFSQGQSLTSNHSAKGLR
jgi:hypothetical protein